jgi:hypothetical protein
MKSWKDYISEMKWYVVRSPGRNNMFINGVDYKRGDVVEGLYSAKRNAQISECIKIQGTVEGFGFDYMESAHIYIRPLSPNPPAIIEIPTRFVVRNVTYDNIRSNIEFLKNLK